MEHCVITLTVPFQNSSMSQANGSVIMQPPSLDAWLLKGQTKLDFQVLSWNTKRKRDRLLGHFSTTPGATQQLVGIPCAAASYLTVELACRKPGCVFEIVATQKNAVGLYVRQHQTI
ncbi:hypothetical protein C8R47DRAFT_1025210 [Mycena vitilis]|nr:hypothetical protein C8R47DRAFT_1025210 [Mycena vitilis]